MQGDGQDRCEDCQRDREESARAQPSEEPMKQEQLTYMDYPGTVVETARGRISNWTWSRAECVRIAKATGEPCWLRQNGGMRIAVMRGGPVPAESPFVAGRN